MINQVPVNCRLSWSTGLETKIQVISQATSGLQNGSRS